MITTIDSNLVLKWNASNPGQYTTPLYIDIECPNGSCDHRLTNTRLVWNMPQPSLGICRHKCMSCDTYIRIFIIDPPLYNNSATNTVLVISPPFTASVDFSDGIRVLSPNFISIFTQAKQAEMYGLDELSGMGYRKAMEFLIKDYLISRNADNEPQILGKMLGKCINDYVDNYKIKECARRTVWLGNDETHYTRKWEDHGIEDLKELLSITTYWIDAEISSDGYINSMPNPQ